MAEDSGIEQLLKEHSFEEVELVRDNLAIEIERRTETLKSIVKEKYRDIVETSDTIQTIRSNLKKVKQNLWSLDGSISKFYIDFNKPLKQELSQPNNNSPPKIIDNSQESSHQSIESQLMKKFVTNYSSMWSSFDSDDAQTSVKILFETLDLLEKTRHQWRGNKSIAKIELSFERARDMMKNNLWFKIESAAPDQIGIITYSDQQDLFQFSLISALDFLTDNLKSELSETSYLAMIHRYQQLSLFDSQKDKIVSSEIESDANSVGLIPIPQEISPELSRFLFRVCRVINIIAGFNLNKDYVSESLSQVLSKVLSTYDELISVIASCSQETKRKRALQLHFDLLFMRMILSMSKNVELIEKYDPMFVETTSQYELMQDSIELYMISTAIHANIKSLSQKTTRLYGLLIPHLD